MIMKTISKVFAAVMLVCMSVVSCTKYDDTEIKDAIADLQNRVAVLEKAVAENVAAIQSMVSLGSVQTFTIDAATGKATITLIDGRKLTFDQQIVGYSLITVEQGEDGAYYWAVCVDGVSTPLMIDGKKVPVAVTPSLMISDKNEWLISADGGKTWIATGIYNQEGSSPSIFQSVKQEGDYLLLTLVDGTEIKVAVAGEFKFAAAETSVYFSKQAIEKSVALEMNNVKAYTITEKPEGWKARVDHNEDEESYTLVLTSPADISSAVTSGTVKILGLYNGGNCSEIISVDVTYEDAFKLSAGVGGVAKVTVAEHSFEDIDGYIVGALKATEFDVEAVAAWLNTEEGYMTEPYREAKEFVISEMVADYDPTEAYVVYAVEHLPVKQMVSGNASYIKENIKHIVLGSTKAKAGISNIRFDYAYLSLEFKDLTGYFGGFADLAFWESMGKANALESITVGNMTPMTAPTYEGPVNLFPDGVEGTQILPDKDYLVWIVPESETGEYTEEDFIIYSFTSSPISADNSIAAPVCEVKDITYGGFSAVVTPVADAYKTYAAIRKTSALPEDELELVTEIIDINQFSEGTDNLEITANSFSSEDEVCIVAVTLTEDGRYGKLYKKIVPLKTLEYSDAMSVSASAKVHGLGDVTVTLTFAGNPSTITYYCTNSNYFGDETMQDMLARGQVGNAVIDQNISELQGGNTIELTGLTLGVEHSFYALVKNADGVPSRMTKISIMPIVMIDYILSSNKSYSYAMPTVTGTKSGSKYTMTVTKPAECIKYWLFIGDFEYMTGSSTVINIVDEYAATDKLVTMQLEDVGALELTEDFSTVYNTLRATTRVYIAWLDDKGNYHAVNTINPNK